MLCLGLALFSLTKVFYLGILAFFFIGIAGGLIGIAVNTIISSQYKETRTSALNLLHAFFGLGALTGPFFSGYMLNIGISWQYIFLSGSSLSAITLLLFIFSQFPAIEGIEKINISSFLKILKNRHTLLIGIATVCYVGAEMGINSWVVLYIEEKLAVKKIIASSFLSYFWFALAFGRILCFSLGKKINDKTLLLSLALSAICFYATFFLSSTPIIAGIALTCTGLALSGVFPTLLAMGSNYFSYALGTITGIIYAFSAVGFLLFPFLIGIVADASSLKIAMIIPLILAILLTCVSWTLKHSD
jgi:fucose permease